jgi:GcrA cell cycle regulator
MAHPAWKDQGIVDELKRLWAVRNVTVDQIASTLSEMAGYKLEKCSITGKARRMGLGSRQGRSGGHTVPESTPVQSSTADAPETSRKKVTPVQEQGKPQAITVMTIKPNMCRWPFGDPLDAEFHFCGKPSVLGKSYCCEHHAKAYHKFEYAPRKPKPKPLMPVG